MSVPTTFGDTREWVRRISLAVNNILNGRIESTGTVTLTASAATTTVDDKRVGYYSVITFMPLTANAAAELGNGTMYIQTSDIDIANNQFTINHANNAQVDRDFRYLITGIELA